LLKHFPSKSHIYIRPFSKPITNHSPSGPKQHERTISSVLILVTFELPSIKIPISFSAHVKNFLPSLLKHAHYIGVEWVYLNKAVPNKSLKITVLSKPKEIIFGEVGCVIN